MNIMEALELFLQSKCRMFLSEKTIRNYKEVITPFAGKLACDICDITDEDINRYFDSALSKPISHATYATYVRTIKVFLRWVSENYEVKYEVSKIRVPRTRKKSVYVYSDCEISKIFDTVICSVEWLEKRNKCIVALMLDSGLRQSEICTLLYDNVRFSESYMVVTGKGNKERTVPLGEISKTLIREYRKVCPYQGEFLFYNRKGEPLTPNAVKLLIAKLSKKLPFEFSSHKLRHNFATNYCLDNYRQKGQVDIYKLMHLLGHEDVDTTRRYLHFAYDIIAAQNNISHLDGALSKKP